MSNMPFSHNVVFTFVRQHCWCQRGFDVREKVVTRRSGGDVSCGAAELSVMSAASRRSSGDALVGDVVAVNVRPDLSGKG